MIKHFQNICDCIYIFNEPLTPFFHITSHLIQAHRHHAPTFTILFLTQLVLYPVMLTRNFEKLLLFGLFSACKLSKLSQAKDYDLKINNLKSRPILTSLLGGENISWCHMVYYQYEECYCYLHHETNTERKRILDFEKLHRMP